MSPYEPLLGPAWAPLPQILRLAHTAPLHAKGTVNVKYGPWGQRFKRLLKLPDEGPDQPVILEVEQQGETMLWKRRFGTAEWKSSQTFTQDRMVEHIGAHVLSFKLEVQDRTIKYTQTQFRIGRTSLPRFLAPRINAKVTAQGESWAVHVIISAPAFGLIWEYEACLTPE